MQTSHSVGSQTHEMDVLITTVRNLFGGWEYGKEFSLNSIRSTSTLVNISYPAVHVNFVIAFPDFHLIFLQC